MFAGTYCLLKGDFVLKYGENYIMYADGYDAGERRKYLPKSLRRWEVIDSILRSGIAKSLRA